MTSLQCRRYRLYRTSLPTPTFTFNYSVAIPTSYGIQAFSTGYAYDGGATQTCQSQIINPATFSEYNSYTCVIPATTTPGTHTLTVGFTGQSAYGYFFVDAVTLTSE